MNVRNNKIKFALILNLAMIVLEIIGLILSVNRHGIKVFLFYTENSNYFALIVSIIFCIIAMHCLIKNKTMPKWIVNLRYVATVCLTITFLVVLFILIPMMPSMLSYLLVEGSSLYQHVLCPILSIISFIAFENTIPLKKSDIFWGIVPTFIYGGIILVLNFLKLIVGPYPFFYVYQVPWYFSSSLCAGIFAFAGFIAYVFYVVNNRKFKKGKTKLTQNKNFNKIV